MMRAATVRRSGFTLVEILIVIAIIATLAGLLLGAIGRVGEVGRKTVAGAEISQMETAVAKFKVDFGFAPPTYIEFPTSANPGDVDQQKAYNLLQKMFRAYDPATDPIAFRGTSVTSLKGVESLAWFLGGPNGTGFTPNKPIAPTGSSVKGPYYNFDERRFIDPETKQPSLSYRDPWGTPYIYFSTGSGRDYGKDDTLELGEFGSGKIAPFLMPGTTKWAAPGQVQIVSAGPDQVFGTQYEVGVGNKWVPGAGQYSDTATISGLQGNGADDISNFNNGVPLGSASK